MYHYDDYHDLDATRAAMAKDPAWQKFLATSEAALASQKSEMFLPATAALAGRGRSGANFPYIWHESHRTVHAPPAPHVTDSASR